MACLQGCALQQTLPSRQVISLHRHVETKANAVGAAVQLAGQQASTSVGSAGCGSPVEVILCALVAIWLLLCSRGGLRILANKAQLQASIPPSKRPRRDSVLRHIRQHVAGMIPPPPATEPECLWAMPTNLLQVSTTVGRAAADTGRLCNAGKLVFCSCPAWCQA